MKDICKILGNAPEVRSVDSRRPNTEDDRSFYEILDGENWAFPTVAAASSVIWDTTGPLGSLGVLPESISCRVSNNEHLKTN